MGKAWTRINNQASLHLILLHSFNYNISKTPRNYDFPIRLPTLRATPLRTTPQSLGMRAPRTPHRPSPLQQNPKTIHQRRASPDPPTHLHRIPPQIPLHLREIQALPKLRIIHLRRLHAGHHILRQPGLQSRG